MTGAERPYVLWEYADRHPVGDLEALLSRGADVARSMWDTSSLLLHLDLDYLNIDVQGEAYHHPAEVFFKIEPVYRAAVQVLHRFGLALLGLTTGQGYHFSGRVPLASPVVDRLAALVPRTPEWLEGVRGRSPGWLRPEITARHARAHAGLGMLAEFLAHKILQRARKRSPIPVVLNGVTVGTGLAGRECTSIDLSWAGDPLDVRHMRVAFGAYQKHRFRPDIVAHPGASNRAPFIAVPRGGDSLPYVISRAREFRYAARAARSRSAVLPDVGDGLQRTLDAYDRSRLGAFHRAFYAAPPRSAGEASAMFDRLRLDSLPDCVLRPLLTPNDWLLQPTSIQHVTRALIAEGIPPRDVAAIVRARYDAGVDWGTRWEMRDRCTRAEFDVRVFAGLLWTGLDRAIDFNCRSAQEKGLCPGNVCSRDLRVDRERLLEVVRS